MRPDEIIKTLERAGFEAQYVGGCVRDAHSLPHSEQL